MKQLQEVKVTQLPESLIQWKTLLVEQLGPFDGLLFQNKTIHAVTDSDYQGQQELVLIGKHLSAAAVIQLASILQQNDIDSLFASSPKHVAGVTCVRLSLSQVKQDTKALVADFCQANQIDFAMQPQLPDFAQPGLVLMDMDSTTIQIECIDEIARLYGVGEQVSAVTARAMNGELDFNESLYNRVALLDGMPTDILNQVIAEMPLMPGLEELIAGLKQAGWKVCIASGGFTYFAQALQQKLGFDQVFANTLELNAEQDKLTGKVLGEVVDASVKARILGELAEQYGIAASQTVAIGDGANDLKMMQKSALGIAIHAKPIVQEQAGVSINQLDLEAALAILTATTASHWA